MEKDKVQEAMDSIQNAQKSLNVHSFDGIADLRGMDIPDKIPGERRNDSECAGAGCVW